MKKTMKKTLIAVCSMAFAFSMSIGWNAVSANAAGEVAVDGNFQMVDGAAIRIKGGAAPSGIRWAVKVSQDYYNYVTGLDANAEFGMLVDNTAIVDVDTNTTEQAIKCTVAPTFENGVWTYYASITYDALMETLEAQGKSEEEIAATLQACYETELWARAYVKYTAESVETYEYAVSADVARSIKGVAMNCLIQENTVGNEDVTADNKSAFETYANGAYTTIASDGVMKNAYNLTTATGTITSQNALAAGEYAVYVGAKRIGNVAHGGGKISATVAGLGSTLAAKGMENNVSFVNANGEVYQVSFVSATHAISTTTELNAFLNSYNNKTDGTNPSDNYYAVLTNDIDYEKKTALPTGTDNSYIFRGTFNGMGYAIKNYIVSGASQKGVFGAIHGNALIENVAFIGAQGNGGDSPLVLGQIYGGTVRNIYVQGCYASHVTTGYRGLAYAGGCGVFSNCIVDIDYPAGSTKTTNVFTGATGGNLAATVYGIGNATRLEPSKTTAPYATVAEMLATNKSNITAANGWSAYWSFDEEGNLYFGDEKVAD